MFGLHLVLQCTFFVDFCASVVAMHLDCCRFLAWLQLLSGLYRDVIYD